MKKWFPSAFSGLCFSGLLWPLAACAQDAPPPAVITKLTLDEALRQLPAVDAGLLKKVEEFRRLIDAEAAAKRVSEPVAQGLRYSLRNALLSLNNDFSAVVTSSRLPVENSALMDAIRILEAEWTNAQGQRASIIKAAATNTRTRIGELTRVVAKAEELDPLITALDQLQELLPARLGPNAPPPSVTTLTNYTPYLRALRYLLDVERKGDAATLSSALRHLQNTASTNGFAGSEIDVEGRIDRALVPFKSAQEEAQTVLDAAIRGGKTTEMATALVKLEGAIDRLNQAQSGLYNRGERNANLTLSLYRNLISIAEAIASGRPAEAKLKLGYARDASLQTLGEKRAEQYLTQFGAWEKALAEGTRSLEDKDREALRTRLAGIKKPAELQALATELFAEESGAKHERETSTRNGLAGVLNALAITWSSGNLNSFRQTNERNDLRFDAELADLRKLVRRDVLTRALRAPELAQPPLAELPPDTALDQLSDELATKGEWRRLLHIAEARSAMARQGEATTRDNDLVTALQSFLAGQNLELAEQWPDAIAAYKAVLRSTNERAPVVQAADRLRALSKAYPEASVRPAIPAHALSPK